MFLIIIVVVMAFRGVMSMSSSASLLRKKVLVIGGSGRVGGSCCRSLHKGNFVDITIAGRDRSNYDAFIKRNGFRTEGDFQFQQLDLYNTDDLNTVVPDFDLIVHTAGPFQGLSEPNVLLSALKHGKNYIDVMDDVNLSRIARSKSYQKLAGESGSVAIVSAGIWPGGSSLLAQESIAAVGGADAVDRVTFDFFTAGSGNAGTTIITATFLILGEDVLTYKRGVPVYKKSATDSKTVDFGPQVGKREVVRLNLIECESCHRSSGVGNVETFFGTAPPFWNRLFAVMANLIPQRALQNRDAMAALASFSMPMIRLIDSYVGSTNSIKVTLHMKKNKSNNGNEDDESGSGRETRVAVMTHGDLEVAVGDSLAAFARGLLLGKDDDGGGDTCKPGVFYPEEMGPGYREKVLAEIASSAIHYSLPERYL
jgi:saccharopine dehydrogenase-like NADP-dependent oxidoreductase